MRILIFIGFLLSISTYALSKEADILVLRLDNKVDGTVVSSVELFASEVSPGTVSIDDDYILKINGKVVDYPVRLLAKLNHSRSSYNHDAVTGGVQITVPKFFCRMGGPAAGSILSVNYMTFQDGGRIEKNEMKPVYSEGNCLFREEIKPANTESEKWAAKAMVVLETLMALS